MIPILYSSPTCQPCKAVKRWLTDHNIPFEESQDLAARMEIDGKRTVPLLVYRGMICEGLDIKKLKEMFPE